MGSLCQACGQAGFAQPAGPRSGAAGRNGDVCLDHEPAARRQRQRRSAENLAFPAGGLAKWAAAAPALFADSTKGVPSRAMPTVWTDKAGFAAKAKAFADSTRALADAAKEEDKAAFDAALASTAASCKGCHDSYQVQAAPPPKAS
ncbi:MAG: cytochrome c [Novosphingobium sp.]